MRTPFVIAAVAVLLLTAFKFFYARVVTPPYVPQTAITQAWWDGLPAEWKAILRINQQFQQHHVDVFALQQEYLNRLNAPGEAAYGEMNTSLRELHAMRRFGLGYADLYERAIRRQYLTRSDDVDLFTLGNLDTLYLVNGPGDLTPLEKFPHLQVLIVNDCGVDPVDPTAHPLDLAPLKHLKALKVLHCSSVTLTSLAPLQDLVHLEELHCDHSSVTSLAPLKKLVRLKRLALGPKVQDAAVVSRLVHLEELYLQECRQIPDLSGLRELKKLVFSESELSLVDARYQLRSLDFLRDLPQLECL
ncbi:MAG TPA: hypothetical protein VF646_00870, partial [Cytophagales bacterium]